MSEQKDQLPEQDPDDISRDLAAKMYYAIDFCTHLRDNIYYMPTLKDLRKLRDMFDPMNLPNIKKIIDMIHDEQEKAAQQAGYEANIIGYYEKQMKRRG